MSGLGIANLFRGSERSVEQIVKLQLRVIDAIFQEVRGKTYRLTEEHRGSVVV